MLPREKQGVVNPDLLVYGTKNLRIVDISVIPLHFAAHPQSMPVQSILAVSEALMTPGCDFFSYCVRHRRERRVARSTVFYSNRQSLLVNSFFVAADIILRVSENPIYGSRL